MSNLTQQQLSGFRGRLTAMKRSIERSQHDSEHGGLANSLKDQTGELSPIDNHPGDVATDMYERSKDLAMHELQDFKLERIDLALEAIDNGTYGVCQTCGRDIPLERLDALPDSLYCVEHAPRQELSDNRAAEEDFMEPVFVFDRSNRDDADGYNGFDGEDAWQIVERYGNSNTPAMSDNRDVESYNEMYTESDEYDGFVEPLESFVATDITGRVVSVVRNRQYRHYLTHGEGDNGLSVDEADDDRG